jgi:copper chaperone CopZ
VTAALKNIEGVNAAAVDYQTGRAEVSFNGDKTSAEALLKAIRGTGFKAEKAKADS